jgi:hypothetical protein
LKELYSRTLYTNENIFINKDWNHVLEQYNDKSIKTAHTNNESDTENESKCEIPTETLIHGFIESQHIHDLQDKIIELALAEGKHPLGIFKDKYAEEMNFPTLFYGNPCDDDITKRFNYKKK